MKRKIVILIALLISVPAGAVLAASSKCEITKIEKNQMVLDCRNSLKGFAQGDTIKIKTSSTKRKQIEGC